MLEPPLSALLLLLDELQPRNKIAETDNSVEIRTTLGAVIFVLPRMISTKFGVGIGKRILNRSKQRKRRTYVVVLTWLTLFPPVQFNSYFKESFHSRIVGSISRSVRSMRSGVSVMKPFCQAS